MIMLLKKCWSEEFCNSVPIDYGRFDRWAVGSEYQKGHTYGIILDNAWQGRVSAISNLASDSSSEQSDRSKQHIGQFKSEQNIKRK